MRWGIHTIEDYHEETHGSLPEFYDKLVARAVLAEELGYESFWLTEHHFHWLGGAHANPLVALSAKTNVPVPLGVTRAMPPRSPIGFAPVAR